jgi:hypothetical protein
MICAGVLWSAAALVKKVIDGRIRHTHKVQFPLFKPAASVRPKRNFIVGNKIVKSERMTERYTHFDPLEFVKAKEIQETLLQPVDDKPQTAERSDIPPNVFSFPAQGVPAEERKQA